MRKVLSTILTFTFIMELSTAAFAANPFTDVPVNHWAYNAVAKLAEAGIIEGYGDGRYFGNRTITRYEMAQIVAKAMVNMDKANNASRSQIERLAAEYADELESLGVRIANLEKKSDNVRIRGEIRYGNFSYDKNVAGSDVTKIRSRIWFSGKVNDYWTYGAMLQNNGPDFKTNGNPGSESRIEMRRAWVDGRIGDIKVTAGRFAYTPIFGIVFDNDTDGLKLAYQKNKFNIEAFIMRPSYTNGTDDSIAVNPVTGNMQIIGGLAGYTFNDRTNLQVAYYDLDGRDDNTATSGILEAGLTYNAAKNVDFWFNYIRGGNRIKNYHVDRDGYVAGIRLGTADRSKKGSMSFRAAYYDVAPAGTISTTLDLDMTVFGDGFKGYQVGATWVPIKNINVNVDYYDYKTQGETRDSLRDRLLFSYIRFYF